MAEPNPTQNHWQRCPVCNGRGWLPHGFYNTSPTFSSASTEDVECRRCTGQGTILSPTKGYTASGGDTAIAGLTGTAGRSRDPLPYDEGPSPSEDAEREDAQHG
jgi:hypothetical protein